MEFAVCLVVAFSLKSFFFSFGPNGCKAVSYAQVVRLNLFAVRILHGNWAVK